MKAKERLCAVVGGCVGAVRAMLVGALMWFLGCASAPVPEIRLVKEDFHDPDGMFYKYHLALNMSVKHDTFVYVQKRTWTVFNTDPPWESTYEMIPAGQMRSRSCLAPDGHSIRIMPAEERKNDLPVVLHRKGKVVNTGRIVDKADREYGKVPRPETPADLDQFNRQMMETKANLLEDLVNEVSGSQVMEVDNLHSYKIGEPSEVVFPVSASHMELYRKMTDD